MQNNQSVPKISVIMPFYNAADFLDEAITSILGQTFDDFEFIIINDASTDDSDVVVKKYLDDSRIVYIKNEANVGIVTNLNKGLGLARSEIIARMDGDDISEPTRFEKQYSFLLANSQVDAVGSFIKIINEEGREIDKRTKPTDSASMKKNILSYLPIVHATAMFRKKALQAIGGYRQEYLYCEDMDLFYRLVFSGRKISNIPEFLYQYRYHGSSVAGKSRLVAKKAFQLRKEIAAEFDLTLTFRQKLMIWAQFAVGMIFSGRQRQFIEGLYKTIFYHGK